MTDWKELLENGYDDVRELAGRLHITEEELPALCKIQDMFPMFVNPYYLSLVDENDPEDPVRKLCIPADAELKAGGEMDTSGEHDNTVMTGMT